MESKKRKARAKDIVTLYDRQQCVGVEDLSLNLREIERLRLGGRGVSRVYLPNLRLFRYRARFPGHREWTNPVGTAAHAQSRGARVGTRPS